MRVKFINYSFHNNFDHLARNRVSIAVGCWYSIPITFSISNGVTVGSSISRCSSDGTETAIATVSPQHLKSCLISAIVRPSKADYLHNRSPIQSDIIADVRPIYANCQHFFSLFVEIYFTRMWEFYLVVVWLWRNSRSKSTSRQSKKRIERPVRK